MTASKANRLLADAFHQTPVTCDHIGVVIHNLFAKTGAQDFFGHGKTNGIRNPLTQWACCCFNRVGKEVFRVTRGFRTQLAEILDLFDWEIVVSAQVQ